MAAEAPEASTSTPGCSPQGPRTRRQKRLAEEGACCLAVTSKEVSLHACKLQDLQQLTRAHEKVKTVLSAGHTA